MSEIRLNKYLASAGAASRRVCDQIIQDGRVTINGELVDTPYTKVKNGVDVVCIDGEEMAPKDERIYYLLNKPRGYICTSKDRHAKKLAVDLFPEADGRLFSIGRLDKDSEGLIIFTNDGDFAQKVSHPSSKIIKVYQVTISGSYKGQPDLDHLKAGIMDEGDLLKPVDVVFKRMQTRGIVLDFELHEGKNREIRRLCRHMDWHVKRLTRTSIGDITTAGLEPGEFRPMTKDEMTNLTSD